MAFMRLASSVFLGGVDGRAGVPDAGDPAKGPSGVSARIAVPGRAGQANHWGRATGAAQVGRTRTSKSSLWRCE